MPPAEVHLIPLVRVAAAALALLIAGAAPVTAQQPARSRPAEADTGAALAASIEGALQQAIARCEKSVVSIAIVPRDSDTQVARGDRVLLPQFPLGPALTPADPDFVPTDYASGVIIDSSGLILTNYHALRLGEDTQRDYYITTAGKKVFRVKGKPRGADPRSDLAVLELADPLAARDAFPPIPMGDAASLRKGQIVISLGNPYAIARDGSPSASWGIVSNLGRKAPALPDEFDRPIKDTIHNHGTLIQTDAKLNLGTSGGALITLQGEMVGLATSIAALAGYDQAAGYAIAVDPLFRRAIEKLKRGEEVEYGMIGVRLGEYRGDLDGKSGAMATGVEPGTPAALADLKSGDLIEAVDDEPLHDTDSLMLAISRRAPAETVTLTIRRNDRPMEKTVTLAKLGVEGRKVVTAPRPPWRGIEVDYRSVLMSRSGLEPAPFFSAGVAILNVENDSPAWKAGLRPNSAITHVNGHAIDTPADFRAAVADKIGPVELQVGGEKITIAANPQ